MKKIVLFLIYIISMTDVIGQNSSLLYYEFHKKADSFYFESKYKEAATNYISAFKAKNVNAETDDLYNAACCLALLNDKDSAFSVLNDVAVTSNYTDHEHIVNDQDLQTLHQDKRWETLLNVILSNKRKMEALLNKSLVAELDSIFADDQNYRLQDDEIEKKYGWDSKERKALWKLINEKDSLNLIKVNAIYKQYGWPSLATIGKQGSFTIFLVIQHSDIKTQEFYLPIMRDAVKKGNALGKHLALLEDRVALRKGNKQIYGSQISTDANTHLNYIRPLEDPDHVDKRRLEVGLEPFSDYLSKFNMKWDVEQYKKELPVIEKQEKR